MEAAMIKPGLTFEESLLVDLWEAVEDQAPDEIADKIAELVGWAELIGTVAGLREKSDLAADKITHDLNAGASWGLEYPVIFGWRPERKTWCAWNRHTGEIVHELEPNINQHGFDFSKDRIKKLSQPDDYYQNPAIYDAIA